MWKTGELKKDNGGVEDFLMIWFVMSNQAMTLVYNIKYKDMIFITFYLIYFFYTKLCISVINK